MKTMTVRYSTGDRGGAETRLTLERGQVASTKEARGLAIECVRGKLWITFEHGGVDHVLEPGERIPVRGGGKMVIEAMAASELVFYRQEVVAETAPAQVNNTSYSSCHSHSHSYSTPECWRNFVGGLALPRANFDSAF